MIIMLKNTPPGEFVCGNDRILNWTEISPCTLKILLYKHEWPISCSCMLLFWLPFCKKDSACFPKGWKRPGLAWHPILQICKKIMSRLNVLIGSCMPGFPSLGITSWGASPLLENMSLHAIEIALERIHFLWDNNQHKPWERKKK